MKAYPKCKAYEEKIDICSSQQCSNLPPLERKGKANNPKTKHRLWQVVEQRTAAEKSVLQGLMRT